MMPLFKRLLLSLVLLSAAALVLLLSDLHSRQPKAAGGSGVAVTRPAPREAGPAEKPANSLGPALAHALAGRQYSIGLVYFGPDEGTDSAIAGLLDGLRQFGLVQGRNLTVRKVHANGEVSAIPALLHSLEGSSVDVVVPFSTPVLTAALASVRRKPIVFTYVSDPLAAGAGRSFEDHLPLVTGIGSFPPVADALTVLRLTFPGFKRLGTLYNN
ncbi:MAG TPA: ABC transporter substrate binding protein, partial [Bacillota bacterium]|nr:ABC transporter substrate binding protein [Bacillota bacterium]